MAVLDIKFTKFDNRPWGFRLAGGSDFPQPLTVLRVTEESLAECMGLKVGDIILKLNDQQIAELTHGQAHEALTLAGNNFVLTVLRAEDLFKLPDIPLENLVPYAIPLESLPPLLPVEEKLKENGIESEDINDTEDQEATREKNEKSGDRERDEEKPTDENSVVVAKKDLTDEQIAELILEEEEILTEKGTLGVNFKKLRPRLPNLKDSKVVEALQKDALEDSPVIQERKRTTTFMQKPERHPPAPKKVKQESQNNVEPYRVVIKKQPKKSITEKLLEKGLIQPEDVKTFESRSEVMPFPEFPDEIPDNSEAEYSFVQGQAFPENSPANLVPKSILSCNVENDCKDLDYFEMCRVVQKNVLKLEKMVQMYVQVEEAAADKSDVCLDWPQIEQVVSRKGCAKRRYRARYFVRSLASLSNDSWNIFQALLTSRFKFQLSRNCGLNDDDKKALYFGVARRLSLIPSVLREGLTDQISIGFTKIVAYACVPIVSCCMLYYYS